MSKCDVKRGQEFDCMWLLKRCGVFVSGLYVLYSYNGHLDAMRSPTHSECTCVSVNSHSHCSCSSSFTNTAF